MAIAQFRWPTATYRVQFNEQFTLADACAQLDYLADLSISHVYASPLMKAVPGSRHGYDCVDPNQLNPEVGTEADFARLVQGLKERRMGLLLDWVPNHMGISGGWNRWWQDVLEHGMASRFAHYFDINWLHDDSERSGKIKLAVLGAPCESLLTRGELQFIYEDGCFFVHYYEHIFPLDPRSYADVLPAGCSPELDACCALSRAIPAQDRTDANAVVERYRLTAQLKQKIQQLVKDSDTVRVAIQANLDTLNSGPTDSVVRILRAQAYQLRYWRDGKDSINYRRFFNVSSLVGMRVEAADVFDALHREVRQWIERGFIQGVRLDHIDGLYDPKQYLERLRELTHAAPEAGQFYIAVEKILEGDEALKSDWPVQGTTGYECLNQLNGLFVDGRNREQCTAVYRSFTGQQHGPDEVLHVARLEVLDETLRCEFDALCTVLYALPGVGAEAGGVPTTEYGRALREIMACFPVYRTYSQGNGATMDAEDLQTVRSAVQAARRHVPDVADGVFAFMMQLLQDRHPKESTPSETAARRAFLMKFQQATGPVMAKGLEDSTFYRYYPLCSQNEVGGDLTQFGVSSESLHEANAVRNRNEPQNLFCTTTHDTKRSEDVRARVNVLSELPAAWERQVQAWREINVRFKTQDAAGRSWPESGTEYLFYQTVLGSLQRNDQDAAAYVERISDYMLKACREAGLYTRWSAPDTAYEQALERFVRGVLAEENVAFWKVFLPFHGRIAELGLLNSYAQTLLKCTCPGIPDIYQGSELLDFRLVDPDNRTPVDYVHRQTILSSLKQHPGEIPADANTRKYYLLQTALALRARCPELFEAGEYIPLKVTGQAAHHAFAFMRRHGEQRVITAVGRFFAEMPLEQGMPVRDNWAGSWIGTEVLQDGETWRDLLSGRVFCAASGGLALDQLFQEWPVVLLEAISP